jgi:hypothetical protein
MLVRCAWRHVCHKGACLGRRFAHKARVFCRYRSRRVPTAAERAPLLLPSPVVAWVVLTAHGCDATHKLRPFLSRSTSPTIVPPSRFPPPPLIIVNAFSAAFRRLLLLTHASAQGPPR